MLNGDAYQVIVQYEGSMHPAEFVGNRQDCYEDAPDEGVLEHQAEQEWFSDGNLHKDVYDKPKSTEHREESNEEAW